MSVQILQQTIASLYKRKGKDILKAGELELLASMELRWFEPNDARKVVAHAVQMGVLENTDAGLKPTFEVGSVEIPIGFRPPKNILSTLEQDHESLFMQMVNHICITTGLDEKKVIGEINNKQAKFDNYITLETIALLYGKEKDLDMDRFIPEVRSKLLSR